MQIRSTAMVATAGLALLLTQGGAIKAAEIKLLAAAALPAVFGELGPQFEQASGHKLVVQYAVAGQIKRQIEGGEQFDLVIIGKDVIDELAQQGKVVPDTNAAIARVGMGVGTRAGAPKPDISSADAFKRALLDAKSVTYIPEGATGLHLVKVFERLGIDEQIKAKTKPQRTPAAVMQTVASGEVELVLSVNNLIMSAPGVELVGSLPGEFQQYLLFTASVPANAKETEAAKGLIKFLTSSAAAAVIKAKGLEPPAP